MSHGSSAGQHVDPDLTPMLDVVMQLLMYFIMCVNFVADEYSPEIKLPDGQSALPINKGEGDVLILSIRDDGQIKVYGQDLMDLPKAKDFLKKQRLELDSKNKGDTAIVIRAHHNADYGYVFQVMSMCKEEGFRRFKLRANMRSADS
jgi:biopolymer transport protein ExbD